MHALPLRRREHRAPLPRARATGPGNARRPRRRGHDRQAAERRVLHPRPGHDPTRRPSPGGDALHRLPHRRGRDGRRQSLAADGPRGRDRVRELPRHGRRRVRPDDVPRPARAEPAPRRRRVLPRVEGHRPPTPREAEPSRGDARPPGLPARRRRGDEPVTRAARVLHVPQRLERRLLRVPLRPQRAVHSARPDLR